LTPEQQARAAERAARAVIDIENLADVGYAEQQRAVRPLQLVSGRILGDDEEYSIARDIAIPVVVTPVTDKVPEPVTQQLRGEVRLYRTGDGTLGRFEIRKETLDSLKLSTVVPREGDAIEECIRFKTGSRSTLYTPLYLQLQPPPGSALIDDGTDADFLLGEVSDYALVSQTHEAAKIEMVILMRHAADRAFNMNTTRRRTIYTKANEIINDTSWTPATLQAAAPIGRSLLNKARELVSMQSDQGKIWRNAKTVDAIRAGAMAVAASLNEAILGI
jgi:hypothetical protein